MARFRYSLQNILGLKEKMETQAREGFASARQALDAEEAKLAGMLEQKRALEQEAVELRQGMLSFRDIDDNELARMLCDQRITEQKARIRRAEEALERARQDLEDAIKDRKIYEKLREKAFEQFLIDENRAESKVIDELTTFRAGQKK